MEEEKKVLKKQTRFYTTIVNMHLHRKSYTTKMPETATEYILPWLLGLLLAQDKMYLVLKMISANIYNYSYFIRRKCKYLKVRLKMAWFEKRKVAYLLKF